MRRSSAVSYAVVLSAFCITFEASGQPLDRIPAEIDASRTVVLAGNRFPLIRAAKDLGPVAPETRLEHMILVLASDAAQQTALTELLDAQQDPHSPKYHAWLTPQSFAERFGVSRNDLDRLVAWLGAQGFAVDEIPAGGRSIIFSGTAGNLESVFHTAIHRYRVNGETHTANASDPSIPEDLVGVVAGISTLHDFRHRPLHSPAKAVPEYSAGDSAYYLAPGDFATIYDLNSLYGSGITGAGQTIAIVARCNIPITDPETFRATFGLPANNPNIIVNGTDPGITSGDELAEADLDSQWSGAVAPGATIDFVVSASTETTDGVDLSAQYIVSNDLAPVMSTSFGLCEAYVGSAEMSFYSNLWQQAASQGITAMIAAGDSGAAGCDYGGETTATGGQAVNGLCSSPYDICVGGTEFNEGSDPGQYWGSSGSNYASALGYIPEMVWNESGSNGGSELWAGGGGVSIVYQKPSWQSAPGVPADGQRDVPDVSLSASIHDEYLFVWEGGVYGIAGTSAASPSFAGIMALVNQQTGEAQGNANLTLYALATLQGSGGRGYFHDIVMGNNTVPGVTGFNAVPGYDQASGLGSVDGGVLVTHWNDAGTAPMASFSLNVSPGSVAVVAGASGVVKAQVAVTGGFNAAVKLSAANLPTGVTVSFSTPTLAAPGSGSSNVIIAAASSAAPGAYSIQLNATGNGSAQSQTLSLTITAPSGCALAVSPASMAVNDGSSSTAEVSCASPQSGFKSPITLSVSGAPEGVKVTFSPTSVTPGTAQSKMTVATSSTTPLGTYTVTVTGTGGGFSLSAPLSVTINPTPAFTLSAAPTSITVLQGTPGQVSLTTAIVGTFSSSIALSATGQPAGVTVAFSPTSIAAPGSGSSTLTITVGSTAIAGVHNLTIKGTGGGLTKTVTLPVTVQMLPAFSISAAQKTLTVGQGMTGAVNVTVSALVGGFDSAVAFSLSSASGGSLPTGLNATFTPASTSAPGSGTSSLSFAPDNTSTPGTYALTITASGASVTRTAALTLTLTPPPSFTLKSTVSSLNTLVGGAAVTATVSTSAVYGFSSTVALSAGSLPSGVTATLTPASIPGSNGKSTLSVQALSSATPGSYTLSIRGTGGSVTASVNITLNIGQLTVTPQASSLAVKHGSSGSVVVNTSIAGSYGGSVALSITGLPKGVTGAFSPSTISTPASGASTLKLTAASTATLGPATLTIKAVSNGVTETASLSLTVQ